MKKYNCIVSGIFIAISCYVLYETGTYKISNSGQGDPSVWPRTLAILMIFLSALLILQSLLKKDGGSGAKIDWKGPGMKKVYLTLALVAGFIVIMNILGMLIGLLLFIPSVMWLMGCKSKVMFVALPVGMVAFVYFFFVRVMTITLPGGIFF